MPADNESYVAQIYQQNEQAVNNFLATLNPLDVLDVTTQALVTGSQRRIHLHSSVTYRQ
jgi:ABC-type transport system involved in cytochrome c biogenesis ATPase subunit